MLIHNLKNYDSYLIMQELDKLSLKSNIMPNALGNYVSFSINNKLSFIDSFQVLSSSLHSLVNELAKDDFKYLREESDSNVLGLVKQEGFYS